MQPELPSRKELSRAVSAAQNIDELARIIESFGPEAFRHTTGRMIGFRSEVNVYRFLQGEEAVGEITWTSLQEGSPDFEVEMKNPEASGVKSVKIEVKSGERQMLEYKMKKARPGVAKFTEMDADIALAKSGIILLNGPFLTRELKSIFIDR